MLRIFDEASSISPPRLISIKMWNRVDKHCCNVNTMNNLMRTTQIRQRALPTFMLRRPQIPLGTFFLTTFVRTSFVLTTAVLSTFARASFVLKTLGDAQFVLTMFFHIFFYGECCFKQILS